MPHHHQVFAPLISVVISIIVGVGCAGPSTTIEQSWSSPELGQTRLQHVVALYDSDVSTIRRSAEDRLVRRLNAQGVQAVPAYAILSNDDRKNIEGAKTKLRAAGYDGLVVMRLVDTEQNIQSSPGGYYGGYYDGWYGGWHGGPYYSSYLYTETIVRVETAAYSLADNKLVWSSLSKTIDPDDMPDLVDDVTKVVATELGRRGVVVATRQRSAPGEG